MNVAVNVARLRAPGVLARAWRHPKVRSGGLLVLVLVLVAALAPWLAPHDPNEQDLMLTLQPPAWVDGGSKAYPLGTDGLGRCVLSRLVYGSRVALLVAVVAALGAMAIGTIVGIVAGYFGGWVDRLVSSAVALWMA